MKRDNEKKVMRIAVLTLTVTCAVLLWFTLYVSYKNHTSGEAEYVSAINSQLAGAVNSKFSDIENIANVIFTDSEFTDYDADGFDNDRYEYLINENALTETISSFGLLYNYSDFGIMYENERFIGTLSATTEKALGETRFEYLDTLMGDSKTKWTTDLGSNNSRVYYLRRVGDYAVFVSSFYSAELFGGCIGTGSLDDANRYFITDTDEIAYSTDSDMQEGLESNHTAALKKSDCTVITKNYVQSSITLVNGWQAVTVKYLDEELTVYRRMALMGVGISVLAVVMLMVTTLVTSPHEKAVYRSADSRSTTDSITGIFNAEAAENLISDKIEACVTGSTMLFALIGIKNYRQIFEKLGTQGVNDALNAVTARLEGFYGENTVVGKTGLNEFVIFADYTDYDLTKAHERLTAGFERLEEVLKDCDFSGGEGKAECCAGAAVYPDISSDYDELYESAKASLEEALQGENRYILREKPFAFKGGE